MGRVSLVTRTINKPTYHFLRQPGAIVDVCDRVGAMYFGPPVERLHWERSIISAGEQLFEAREALLRCGRPDDVLPGGIQCDGPGGSVSFSLSEEKVINNPEKRPQNIRDHPVTVEDIVRTLLRSSPAIQTVASFQNGESSQVACARRL